MTLTDKVAIITGGGRGIGQACATRLAAEGAKVVIAERDEDAGQQAVKELTEAGRVAKFVACDVSERLDVMNLMAAVTEAHGRVDILVNNAGVVDEAPFLELTTAEFDRVMGVNLRGAFMVGQSVARLMVAQGESAADSGRDEAPGTIINMASVNAQYGLADKITYAMTKAGIQSLTKGMALALAPHGIRVNAVAPGSIMTPMLSASTRDEETRRRKLSRTPLGRFGKPGEIASVVAFLASDDASYITGETIYVDGGRLPLHYTVPVEE